MQEDFQKKQKKFDANQRESSRIAHSLSGRLKMHMRHSHASKVQLIAPLDAARASRRDAPILQRVGLAMTRLSQALSTRQLLIVKM